jgi:hypothetical protein
MEAKIVFYIIIFLFKVVLKLEDNSVDMVLLWKLTVAHVVRKLFETQRVTKITGLRDSAPRQYLSQLNAVHNITTLRVA